MVDVLLLDLSVIKKEAERRRHYKAHLEGNVLFLKTTEHVQERNVGFRKSRKKNVVLSCKIAVLFCVSDKSLVRFNNQGKFFVAHLDPHSENDCLWFR